MATILISDIEQQAVSRLRDLAKAHGRTLEAEAKAILEEIVQSPRTKIWDQINAIREQLSRSNRFFGDSVELLREDRDR